jgi:hypothetical protein
MFTPVQQTLMAVTGPVRLRGTESRHSAKGPSVRNRTVAASVSGGFLARTPRHHLGRATRPPAPESICKAVRC